MRSYFAALVFCFPVAFVVADDSKGTKALPKKGDVVEKGGWYGKDVLPKKPLKEIRIGDWVDGKAIYWQPHSLRDNTVREDRGGFLRVHDGRREGWVDKDDFVTLEDASAYFDKLVTANPKDSGIWMMRGYARMAMDDLENAIADFDEAIRLKPDSATPYINRGITRFGQHELEKAIADFTRAIELDPKSVEAYANRGLIWHDTKEYEKALADYDQCLKLDPKEAMVLTHRGRVYCDKKAYA